LVGVLGRLLERTSTRQDKGKAGLRSYRKWGSDHEENENGGKIPGLLPQWQGGGREPASRSRRGKIPRSSLIKEHGSISVRETREEIMYRASTKSESFALEGDVSDGSKLGDEEK